jgi:hypothetical protein
MGMSPYKMVYGKACHLPLELEYKAYWAVRELNKDPKLAGKKRLLQSHGDPPRFTLWNLPKLFGMLYDFSVSSKNSRNIAEYSRHTFEPL